MALLRTMFRLTAIIFLMVFVAACGSPRRLGNPQSPYPHQTPPEIGQIMHLPTGIAVSEEQMLKIATDNRIVYVGETHDNPASHRLQLTVIKAMFDRYPNQVAIGMEMFTPAQDEALQKWINNESSEKEFLREAGWYKVWKDDFDYYRDILNFAREKKIPTIGLNADKKTVRLLVANEPEKLSAENQALIPEMDLADPYQRGMIEGIYGGHVKSKGMLDGFHRAQTLWDETMADSIVKFMQKEENEDFRMVIIAGGNHVRYGFGIPRRVFRRMPTSYTSIGGKEIEIPESKKDKLMDVTLPEFPMTPYDFVVFTRYEELDKNKVKLGVMLEEKEGEVIIAGIIPGSNADRAGLLINDIIIAIDNEQITDNFDVIYSIKQKIKGDQGIIRILRNGSTESINVDFQDNQQRHLKHND